MPNHEEPHDSQCDDQGQLADQPKPPAKKCKDPEPPNPDCPKPKPPEPPTLPDIPGCSKAECTCPSDPVPPTHCLQDLITEQAGQIVAAQNAENFKKVLEDLMKKSEAVRQEYTQEKYEKLLEEWGKQDTAIAELIRKLVCAVTCWKCVLDCHVCPLIDEIHKAEKRLFDDGKFCKAANDLYDIQYWHQRNRDAKQREFDRIQKVMTGWEKPADTIAGVLAKNKALIDKSNGVIGTEPGKAIFDVFLILVPMHLAIAPPSEKTKTAIKKKYTQFCCGCEAEPNNCCGPDVGPWSIRERMIHPQPYLIDPNEYLNLFCCLVQEFYGPARKALIDAEVELADVNGQIDRAKKQYEDGLKNFEKNGKAAIPSVIDCSEYKPKPKPPQQEQPQQQQDQPHQQDQQGGYRQAN